MNKESKNNGYYRSLARRMISTVIIVSLTPMILVSGIILYQFNISYLEKTNAHLEELILKHKQSIDSFLKEKLGSIRFLAKTYSFQELSNDNMLEKMLSTQ